MMATSVFDKGTRVRYYRCTKHIACRLTGGRTGMRTGFSNFKEGVSLPFFHAKAPLKPAGLTMFVGPHCERQLYLAMFVGLHRERRLQRAMFVGPHREGLLLNGRAPHKEDRSMVYLLTPIRVYGPPLPPLLRH